MLRKILGLHHTESQHVLVIHQVENPGAKSAFHKLFIFAAVHVEHNHRDTEHHQCHKQKKEEVFDVTDSLPYQKYPESCFFKQQEPVKEFYHRQARIGEHRQSGCSEL